MRMDLPEAPAVCSSLCAPRPHTHCTPLIGVGRRCSCTPLGPPLRGDSPGSWSGGGCRSLTGAHSPRQGKGKHFIFRVAFQVHVPAMIKYCSCQCRCTRLFHMQVVTNSRGQSNAPVANNSMNGGGGGGCSTHKWTGHLPTPTKKPFQKIVLNHRNQYGHW